jgi:hypothetical protein
MKNIIVGILIFLILITPTFMVMIPIKANITVPANFTKFEKKQLSFAAFTDTHIGTKYQNIKYILSKSADNLDKLGIDLVENTNLLDFAVNLGDIINHNTAQVNGNDLPWCVSQYKNNLKAYHISNINLPFHCVLGNHDINDYEMNDDDPHNLTKSLIDELSMNNPVYAMLRSNILFLVVPELGYVTWTHPVEYEWVEFMTSQYPNKTTIILSHQAIENTTKEKNHYPYRGKQDMNWWANLFRNNPQIKMWIHGHNHYIDWYVGNQTTGVNQKEIWQFGHEMVFSSPYPQTDWYNMNEEDRIVIYNISSTGITTTSWENNGFGGHWVSGYDNCWNIPTTFDPNEKNWYSFPMFLQDNETQLTDMKLLSSNIILQLVGTKPMELFYDSKMESPNGHCNEVILGFGKDRVGNVNWINPGMEVHGPTFITFPEKFIYAKVQTQEDGRSGPAYRSFPMGTICAAVPGQTYNFTITAKSNSGVGNFEMYVNCTDWGTRSQYSTLTSSETKVFSHTFGSNYETIHGFYTVPDNENAWFLQGRLNFLDSTDYDVSLFSVKRQKNTNTTDNFHLKLNEVWYNLTDSLNENEYFNYTVDPTQLSDTDGVMNFNAYIDGNHFGMVNVIYREPLLLCRNARFRVNSYNDSVFNISLTKTITRNSPFKMLIWNSKVFKKFPIIMDLTSRILLKGFFGKLIEKIFAKKTAIFKMFPFSTDEMYNNIEITSDDGSGAKNISKNGNIWLSCNCPYKEIRYVNIDINNN